MTAGVAEPQADIGRQVRTSVHHDGSLPTLALANVIGDCDAARHQRAIAKIDRDVRQRLRIRDDANDLPALDNHRRIGHDMPPPINHPRRTNDHGLGGGGGGEKECEEERFHRDSFARRRDRASDLLW